MYMYLSLCVSFAQFLIGLFLNAEFCVLYIF